ncbi:MAG: 3,4-dihydroxy 2-butanone 4-phosphate synthase / GTP cyclohydrolase II [Pelagibacterales bacterium]|jgi:3,4-dihydroxy 2-butanone 4-phosphate synthase/GTP cyclohydrolase II|nr:3,4-dihydroxy 2-butanone 4-phosphate synthase / GTP cyclohydrolase II [Pelagibacterales bacterium]
MIKKIFSPIKDIIKDAKKGKMFILVDDKDRENEGDLIIPGSKCNSKSINFMAKHGRGLICLALTKNQIDKLKLPLMSPANKSRMQTAFTISIEAKRGITTGISAYDRAKTIKVAINPNSKNNDIVSPGHVFPLASRSGGVLERAGHTEASVDISKLSKLNPSSVICEVMNEDGRMARLNDLHKFSSKHNIKIASIEDLIAYRLRNEKLIHKILEKQISFKNQGKLSFFVYRNKLNLSENFVIKKGKFISNNSIRVRVITTNLKKGNLIFKNSNVKRSLNYLSKFSNFLLIIINNKKIDKNEKENITLRYYGIGAQIIKDFKVKNMILVTRKRKKIIGLEGFGLKIKKQEIIK